MPQDASRVAEHLGDSPSMAGSGCSLSRDGANLFAYGASKDLVEGATTVIASTLDELGLSATTVRTDKWLAADARWGDPDAAPGGSEGEDDGEKPKQGWLASIVDGLLGGGPVP